MSSCAIDSSNDALSPVSRIERTCYLGSFYSLNPFCLDQCFRGANAFILRVTAVLLSKTGVYLFSYNNIHLESVN